MTHELPPPDVHGGLSGDANDLLVSVDFSVSLNAFGPAPCVIEAVHAAEITTYPDPTSARVRRHAGEWWECNARDIVFGAGVSELIYATTRAFVRPGDPVVIVQPTFGEYRRAVQLQGAIVYAMEWRIHDPIPDMTALLSFIHAVRPVLTFVCTPNNPTGRTIRSEHLLDIANACANVHGLLVIDQSYDAFLEAPLGTPVLRDHPTVIHLRSITKDHALAGIRAGFAIGPAQLMQQLELVRPPWSVSTIAQEATIAAMSENGDAHLATTIPQLRAERQRIESACEKSGLETIAGETHTILIDVADATVVQRHLLVDQGLRTRDCTSFALPRYIRVAARTASENDKLIAVLPTINEIRSQHGLR